MGNKTAVIQSVYDRVSRLTNYGINDVRVGSVETARKHTDLPVIWVGLESGREAGNFKNGASVDAMRISLSILDNKLKLTNNTLFRAPENGGGDNYAITSEVSASVTSGILQWFSGLQNTNINTSYWVNGAYMLTSGGNDAATSMGLHIEESVVNSENFIDLMTSLQYRSFTVGDSVVNVLCSETELPGFSYNGVAIGAAVSINFEGGLLSVLPNIKRHTLRVSDAWDNEKAEFYIYTYNAGEALVGDTVKLGEEGHGALIVLEKMLDALDVTSAGVPDITISGSSNNRRDIDYIVDSSGDYVLIQTFIDVESKIFINGSRSG
jgi:hypothetical protein